MRNPVETAYFGHLSMLASNPLNQCAHTLIRIHLHSDLLDLPLGPEQELNQIEDPFRVKVAIELLFVLLAVFVRPGLEVADVCAAEEKQVLFQ